MKNEIILSIKDFNERLAFFEGSNNDSKKEKEKNNEKNPNKGKQNNKNTDNDIYRYFNNKVEKKAQRTNSQSYFNPEKKINNKHIDEFILERLKIFYNPAKNEEKHNIQRKTNSNQNIENSKVQKNNTLNISKEDEIKTINRHINGIRHKESFYNINEKNFPKKLNLKEIFKNMNIEQIASNVNEEKRKELMKLSIAKREEEKNNENVFNSSHKEEENINSEKEIKSEKNKPEKTIDKSFKTSNEQINKEERQDGKNFISSLNDIYNNKFITINNTGKIKEKKETMNKETVKSTNITNTEDKSDNSYELYINTENNVFLNEKIISNSEEKEDDNNKYCECFFIVSFPTEEGKIAPNSESYPSDCRHKICSMLPAMEPDIIYKYPENISNFEINNLAASICFPNGIKLCYEDNDEKIKNIKNYRSTLTNLNGNMFFVYTYHFYVKMSNEEFRTIYSMNPIRYQLTTYQDELCTIFTEELEENIVKKLDVYSECNFKENVYIPFCLGLISKYPYYPQMEKSLSSIFEGINNMKSETNIINNLITYILRSIPTPPKNSKISFALPYTNKICEIYYPYFHDILLYGNNPMIILEYFSINNIICIFKLLILEQKVLVIGKDMDKISEIILNFISLLYPFEWIHTFIPVMSMKMLKFLQSFLPFLNGMNLFLFKEAKYLLSKSDNVFIINIEEDVIDISNNLKKKDKSFKGYNYVNKNFPALPKAIENLLLKELKLIKIELEKYKNYNIFDKQAINNRIKNLFLQVFVELLSEYDKYTYIVDDYPVINAFSMINDKPKQDKKFYEELTSTQMFQMFVQKSLFNEELNVYFDNKIKKCVKLKKSGNSFERIVNIQSQIFDEEFSSSQKINKNYIIKPYLIQDYNKFEEDMKNKKKSITLKDINEFIFSQNFKDEGKNKNRSNKHIIDKLFKFNKENNPNSYKIFLIPNNIMNKKEETNLEKINLNSINKRKRRSTKIKIISGEKENNEEVRYAYIIKEKEDELNEEQKEEIVDNIKDIMKKVFKSKLDNIKEDKEILMDSVKTKFGRDYFVNIMSSGNKKNIAIKIVENDSFNFLKYIIFNVLLNILKLEENNHNLFSAIKLTKACLYIKTIKNKKEVSLSDEIFSQLEDYSLYKNKLFWQNWIEDELSTDEINIYQILKLNGDESIKNDRRYILYMKNSYRIIDKLFGVMVKLKLSNFFIYSTYSELSREYIFDDEQFGKLMKEMINGLEYYQKLSKK